MLITQIKKYCVRINLLFKTTHQVFTYSQSRDHIHMGFSVYSRICKYVDLIESYLKKKILHIAIKSTLTYLQMHTIYFLTSESNGRL